jgi:hypothetical protein
MERDGIGGVEEEKGRNMTDRYFVFVLLASSLVLWRASRIWYYGLMNMGLWVDRGINAR